MIDSDGMNPDYVFDDKGKDLPTPVFSSVTLRTPVPFILPMMPPARGQVVEMYIVRFTDPWFEHWVWTSRYSFSRMPPLSIH